MLNDTRNTIKIGYDQFHKNISELEAMVERGRTKDWETVLNHHLLESINAVSDIGTLIVCLLYVIINSILG